MKRTSIALFGALEALIALAIGLGVLAVPATLMWSIGTGFAGSWTAFWSSAVDFWLLGNGVPLSVSLPDSILAPIGVAGADEAFGVALVPLAVTGLIIALALRTGFRAADTAHWISAFLGSVITYTALTAIVVATANHSVITFSSVWAHVAPPLIFAVAMIAAIAYRQYRHAEDILSEGITALLLRTSESARAMTYAGLRVAGIGAALLLGVSALVLGILLVVNYPTVIALYETGGFGVGGGLIMTFIQLLFLPTFLIWVASWIIGPGFTLGTGVIYGPLGTVAGPVPAVPIFGALPADGASLGWLMLIVPLLAAFIAGMWLRRERVDAGLLSIEEARWAVGIAAVASGLGIGILAWLGSGALGPGNLADIGPTAWLVGLCFAVEVAIGAAIGVYSGAIRRMIDRG